MTGLTVPLLPCRDLDDIAAEPSAGCCRPGYRGSRAPGASGAAAGRDPGPSTRRTRDAGTRGPGPVRRRTGRSGRRERTRCPTCGWPACTPTGVEMMRDAGVVTDTPPEAMEAVAGICPVFRLEVG